MADDGHDLDRNSVALKVGGKTTRVLRAGDIIGENYRLKGLLGRGGMGYVFRAEHIIIDKDYALKILAPDQINEITWHRFQSEGKAIARLDHPNIVKIYNMGVEGTEFPYLVMDILEGMALSDCIADKVALSVDEILDIFIQLASGFGYAHSRGIIHRDVKPSNVMLVDSGARFPTATIVDFGIAKVANNYDANAQSLTATGEIFGSPYYMSPEQCLGTAIDHRSDIYSLGCTLFEALCGHPPFVGQSAMQTVLMHQNEPSPTLESVDGKYSSEEMEALVAKMLMKRPADRYQSMDQVRHDLERIREHKAVGKNVETGFKSSVDSQLEEIGAGYDEEKRNRRRVKIALSVGIAGLLVFVGVTCKYLYTKNNTVAPRIPAATKQSFVKTMDLADGSHMDEPGLAEAKKQIDASPTIISSIGPDGMRVFHCPAAHLGAFTWHRGFKNIVGIDFDELDDGRVDAYREARVPPNEPIILSIDIARNREAYYLPQVMSKFGAAELAGINVFSLTSAEDISTEPELLIIKKAAVNLVESLSGWTNLQSVEFRNVPVPMEGLIKLDKHTELRQFKYCGESLDVNGLAQRQFLKRLSSLTLGPLDNCDPVLLGLKDSTAIQCITLLHSGVSAAGFSALASCPNLKVLNLVQVPVDIRALEAIASCKSLKRLRIDETRLTPNQMSALAKFRGIEKVELSVARWPVEKLLELQKALPNCTLPGHSIEESYGAKLRKEPSRRQRLQLN